MFSTTACATAFVLVASIDAKLLFDGSASRGVNDVWKILNFEGKGANVDVVDDPTHGKVWRFFKPKGAHRAEGHGAKGFEAKEGSNIYIGWLLKLDHPLKLNTFANFQWKAYGRGMKQYIPFKVKANKGNLFLEHRDGRNVIKLWTSPLKPNQWVSLVLRIHVSRNAKKGYVEFWYNGKRQTLSNGKNTFFGRSLDGQYCDPKWGSYGGDSEDVTTYVSSIRIGTTYEDVAPALRINDNEAPPQP